VYPPIEPYETGMLEVGDGCSMYYELSGNPGGKPALVLHGGPGSGSTPQGRRQFDPTAWRVVQFDQRGCGRSTPHASRPDADLSTNTTRHLLADIERLRLHLGIERWLLRGSSWGSVLALVYAEVHPEHVSGMVLSGVASGRRLETELLTRRLGRLFPEAWKRFTNIIPVGERDGDLAAAYSRLLFHANPEVRATAARAWCDWEIAMVPTALAPPTRYESPDFRMAFARLVTHYWSNGSWLEDGQVLRNAAQLASIPGVIVQGRLDLTNLSGTPWELATAWPGSELVIIDETGHEGNLELLNAIVAATDKHRNFYS
jgi:proline iminopeptidase